LLHAAPQYGYLSEAGCAKLHRGARRTCLSFGNEDNSRRPQVPELLDAAGQLRQWNIDGGRKAAERAAEELTQPAYVHDCGRTLRVESATEFMRIDPRVHGDRS
jgi:hypothetical protein